MRVTYFMALLLALLLAACSAPAAQESPPAAVQNISPQELADELQQPDRPFLLDVREPFEAEIASIPGTSQLIPLGELQSRLSELDPQQDIVIYCRTGNRSGQAMRILQEAGFDNVRNLSGGIVGWSNTVDPSMPTY